MWTLDILIRKLRIAVLLAALCGILVHYGLMLHVALQEESFTQILRGYVDSFWYSASQTSWLLLVPISILFNGAPYFALAAGVPSLKTTRGLISLLLFALLLIGIHLIAFFNRGGGDVGWYFVFAPIVFTPIAGVFFLFALLIEKFG